MSLESHDHNHDHNHDHDDDHIHTSAAQSGEDHPLRPAFFQEGEIILLVSHPKDFAIDNWKNVLKDLNERAGIEIITGEDQATSAESGAMSKQLSGYEQQPFSIFNIPVQSDMPSVSLLRTKLNIPAITDEPGAWQKSDGAVVDALNSLNNLPDKQIGDVLLEAAAPNWFSAGSPHVLVDGGPGAVPIKFASPSPIQAQYSFDKSQVEKLVQGCSGGKPAHVFVLDTALPPILAAQAASHPMFDHQGAVRLPNVMYASALRIDLPQTRPPAALAAAAHIDYSTHRGNYTIADHGMFIAGIISNIAPNAEIELLEVLNNEGVGTSFSLADGLRAIATDPNFKIQPNQALIVNCSFGFPSPQPNNSGFYELVYLTPDGSEFTLSLTSPDLIFKPIEAALEQFYERFKDFDVQIVAAAGNDGWLNKYPPPAHYPAAFPSVLGVGALDDECDNRAWYSNLADNPAQSGVMVFGGKAIPKTSTATRTSGHPVKVWGETDPKGGILSAYSSEFPRMNNDGRPDPALTIQSSQDGWGLWAGTSFACAVMSGILAYAAGYGCKVSIKPNTPSSFYRLLLADPSTKRTYYDEVIISAPQGVPERQETAAPAAPLSPTIFKKSRWQQLLDLIAEFFRGLIEIFK